jgi:Dolichyl-phosphate-mannose-protein mannosyltransferase
VREPRTPTAATDRSQPAAQLPPTDKQTGRRGHHHNGGLRADHVDEPTTRLGFHKATPPPRAHDEPTVHLRPAFDQPTIRARFRKSPAGSQGRDEPTVHLPRVFDEPTVRLRNWLTPWPTEDQRHPPNSLTYPRKRDPGYEFTRNTKPAYELRPPTQPAWSAAASRRRTWVSRSILICLLLIQALLSLRLHNTAFEDEALYLFAGHAELDHLLHGTPVQGAFNAYFSGAPMLYPVLAAIVDSVLGLAGVRVMSLLFMLASTALLYSFTRRLFNERAGLCGAGSFAVAQSTLFMGNFATFDAMALFLLSAATWIVVYTAQKNLLLCLLAAPVAALAVAVKYAAALYLPTIVLVLVLTALQRFKVVRALLRGALMAGLTVGLLVGALYLTDYLQAIQFTTTNRAHGTTGATEMLGDCLRWGGLLFAAACLGTIMYARRGRMSEMPGWAQTMPGARWRLALGVVLTGTALLAPAYQIHLATAVSLHKHLGYGLLFAAPMAGVGVTRVMGAHFKYPQLAIMLGVAMLAMGMSQSSYLFRVWPDSTQLTSILRQEVKPGGHYLADTYEVPVYYLGELTSYQQWNSTYLITYTDHQGHTLTGIPGFRAAIDDEYFDLVVLDLQQPNEASNAVRKEMRDQGRYRLLASAPYTTSTGPSSYEIWVKDGAAGQPIRATPPPPPAPEPSKTYPGGARTPRSKPTASTRTAHP